MQIYIFPLHHISRVNELVNEWVDRLQVSPTRAVPGHWHSPWRWRSGGLLSHWQGHDRFGPQIRQLLLSRHRFLAEFCVLEKAPHYVAGVLMSFAGWRHEAIRRAKLASTQFCASTQLPGISTPVSPQAAH